MTNPALKHSIRRAFKGVAGRIAPDLEDRAIRAIGQRHIRQRRHKAAEVQEHLRREAVRRRIEHQMKAAEYARDRRQREKEKHNESDA